MIDWGRIKFKDFFRIYFLIIYAGFHIWCVMLVLSWLVVSFVTWETSYYNLEWSHFRLGILFVVCFASVYIFSPGIKKKWFRE